MLIYTEILHVWERGQRMMKRQGLRPTQLTTLCVEAFFHGYHLCWDPLCQVLEPSLREPLSVLHVSAHPLALVLPKECTCHSVRVSSAYCRAWEGIVLRGAVGGQVLCLRNVSTRNSSTFLTLDAPSQLSEAGFLCFFFLFHLSWNPYLSSFPLYLKCCTLESWIRLHNVFFLCYHRMINKL